MTEVIRLKPSVYTYTAGPQFTYRKSSRYQPFARVLFGVANSRSSANLFINDVPQFSSDARQTETAFDIAAGGGFDYHASEHVAFRTSADYMRTYFSSLNQNNLRVSVGLTYRFTGLSTF